MNKTICIYHANCCDGMGAAWVVHQALNENDDVEFIAASYQGELPEVKDAHVVIVDFSFKQDQMRQLAKQAASVLVIDHHKTAQAELIPLIESGVIQGVFDMTQSGAMLTWNHFFPGQEPPALIKHIQDRDLWKFELPGTREIQAALYSYPMELDVWDKLMELDVQQLYQEGVAIDRAHLKNVKDLVEFCAFESVIAGNTVPTLNCNYMFASDAGNIMAEGVLFSATYQETGGYRKYSLRSVPNGGIDVSEIAARFGGGGHKHAAGFKIALSELSRLLCPDATLDEDTLTICKSTIQDIIDSYFFRFTPRLQFGDILDEYDILDLENEDVTEHYLYDHKRDWENLHYISQDTGVPIEQLTPDNLSAKEITNKMLGNCKFLENLKAEILKLSEDEKIILNHVVALQYDVNDIIFSLPDNPRAAHRNHLPLTVVEGGKLSK
ncbi:DHHA1 domain-containing protein [Vibrio vulnificus]|uniref:DHHA1 domain-containing protein n=1 Tax=Vibrio vulnificus TaxID=672 RepID=UPI001FAE192C|nr:DHHA1 domain-containing protein [Vibrio vulnificus]MCJ0820219.1 DHHA1 domain-containing protein [Vibrio vulnificus]HDY8063151.1 hypothetical protein [Vibrio vulnificus]